MPASPKGTAMRVSPILLPLAALTLVGGAVALAQIEGTRGLAPVDTSASYEVSGVTVDVAGKTADAARYAGWRIAQRKGWEQLSKRLGGTGAAVSDGTLDSIVSGIIIENEQIGPTRYVAKLGVLFDRARAGSILGISTYASRSLPMLVLPVQWSSGVGQVFEQRSDWQAAWARYRTGNSTVDYVRPSGTGADSLLLDVGQTGRPGRGWWRRILDQYAADDVLIPVVRLYRQWPGGPVIGVFEARFGPDDQLLQRFTLRVGSATGLAQLLDTGVARMDTIYQTALNTGVLRPDPSLSPPPAPTPVEQAVQADALAGIIDDLQPGAAAGVTVTVTVQFDTPGAASVSATENAVRGVPGVRSAATASLALGGVSLMRVVYEGDPDALKTGLEGRGFLVFGSGQTLRIRRAPQLLPDIPADDSTAG